MTTLHTILGYILEARPAIASEAEYGLLSYDLPCGDITVNISLRCGVCDAVGRIGCELSVASAVLDQLADLLDNVDYPVTHPEYSPQAAYNNASNAEFWDFEHHVYACNRWDLIDALWARSSTGELPCSSPTS